MWAARLPLRVQSWRPRRYRRRRCWLLPLTAASLLLANSAYRVYLGRIEEERRNAQRMSELHLATIEALALAIDAKDQTAPQPHPPRPDLRHRAGARPRHVATTRFRP